MDEIIKDIAATVKESVQSGMQVVQKLYEARIDALEKSIIELNKTLENQPKPEKGDKGDSISIDDIKPVLKELVDAIEIPQPKDGEDGKSISIEEIKPIISEAVEEAVKLIPTPKDGEDGQDGKPVELEEVKALVAEIVKAEVGAISVSDGKDAEPINMAEVATLIQDAVKEEVAKIELPKDGADGDDGKPGEDGRDALDIEILPAIDESKSYKRNTYAMHNGGLWRSFEKTNKMRGWDCIIDGVGTIDINYDGERQIKLTLSKSSGAVIEKEINMPILIERGVFRENETYSMNDGVTYGGSYWIAKKDNPAGRPGASDDFRLAVKRGRDGRESVKIITDKKPVKVESK